MSGHDAAIEAVKQQLPSAEQLFAGWPTVDTAVPGAVYTDVDLYQTGGFKDPRLVLYTGVSRLPTLTVGWCLFGASRNVQPGKDKDTLPSGAREALNDTTAVRALQLLAADHPETDEAAIEALTVPGVTGSLVALASAVHQDHEGRAVPIGCEVGTAVYAYHHGPVYLGTVTADVVLIGSPIWIAKTETNEEGSTP
ncbi:hypothetical protein [Streptomyces ipomoeae]|uniref:hypothetical protein n=1 Tax=Streptomyces ipomoeae TaxID=103232 RepID=UPI0029B0E21E|nr:hypothetical protein [Streptomyces ipomoeae]MDX2692180.1 hypothetical protein [Streptomyces ipomoeae]MDX2839287.1 hypothetical protein [Streptomyces ipomoeae]